MYVSTGEILLWGHRLWTDIHLSYNIESIKLCLEHSRNTDINLYRFHSTTHGKVDFPSLMHLSVPHYTRILRFDLNLVYDGMADGTAWVSHVLSSALPVIVSLALKTEDVFLPKLDQDRVPSLRHLNLPEVPLHLSHLTSLTLSDTYIPKSNGWSRSLNHAGILNSLEPCTSLEVFTYIFNSWEPLASASSGHDRA